jgi:hypothetical protein
MEVRAPPLAPLVPIGGQVGCDSLARTDIGRYSFGAHEGGSDFSVDQLASTSTHRRAVRIFAYACFVALIGAGYGLW